MKNQIRKFLCSILVSFLALAATSCSSHFSKIQPERSVAAIDPSVSPTLSHQLKLTLEHLKAQQAEDGSWSGTFVSDVTQDAVYLAAGKKLGLLQGDMQDRALKSIFDRMDPSQTGWTAYPHGPIDPTVTGFTIKVLEYIGIQKSDSRVSKAWEFYLSKGGDKIQNSTLRMQLGILDLIPRATAMPPMPHDFLNLSYDVGMKRLGIHGELLYSLIGVIVMEGVENGAWAVHREDANSYVSLPLTIGRASQKNPFFKRRTKVELLKQIVAQSLQTRGSDHAWYGTLFTACNLLLLKEAQRVGLGDFNGAIADGWKAMDAWWRKSDEGFWAIQPMRSDNWDTAAVLTTLTHVPADFKQDVDGFDQDKGLDFLIKNRVDVGPDSYAWSFDSRDRMLPDLDDTAAVVHAFANGPRKNDPEVRKLMKGAIDWILEKQNKDGGFPAWSKGVSQGFYGLKRMCVRYPLSKLRYI
jgi:sporulenol synthase